MLNGFQKELKPPSEDILKLFMKKTYSRPSFEIETKLRSEGYALIAGVDEVGRGALAGPIVAAAVVFDIEKKFEGLRKIVDSKIINKDDREDVEKIIRKEAISIGIGTVEVSEIDKFGIGAANILAFDRALQNIKLDFVLIDGRNFRGFNHKFSCIEKGESKSISIAAASIIAKVYRDNLMDKLHIYNSIYGFNKHKGYGAKLHIEAIKKHGPSKHHRKSFLKNILNKNIELI